MTDDTFVIGDRLKPGYRQLPDPLSHDDLCWLAGLLEGEGYFSLHPNRHPHPRIQLQMTDKDVVDRAARLFGGNKVRMIRPASTRRQTTYRTEISGRPAAHLMEQLRPLMGQRRVSKIDEVLDDWRARTDRRTDD